MKTLATEIKVGQIFKSYSSFETALEVKQRGSKIMIRYVKDGIENWFSCMAHRLVNTK